MDDIEKTGDIIEKIANIGYYKGIETRVIYDTSLRKRIRTIAEKNGWHVTQWMTSKLSAMGLDASSLDLEKHKKVISILRDAVKLSAECGAQDIAMVCGKDLGDNKREEAKKKLADIIFCVGDAMKEFKKMRLLIEPVDRFAHKKGTIGTTADAVALIKSLHQKDCNVYLCWDSAHIALNEENLKWSLAECAPYTTQIHLANAVLDKSSELYGDWHIPIGKSGFLNEECSFDLLNSVSKTKLAQGNHYVSVEVRCQRDENAWEHEKKTREFLKAILEKKVI